MAFKFNISDKTGKSWKLELEAEHLSGKSVGDKIEGKEIDGKLEGYELEITGGSDIAGFPLSKDIEGIGLKKVLLKKGWGMLDNRKGVRLRKTLRGKQISNAVVQINLKVVKEGGKKLADIFPEQNKAKEEVKTEMKADAKEVNAAGTEAKSEERKAEAIAA